MAIADDVKTMSDDELNWALSLISQEISVRKEIVAIPQKMDALNREYLAASGSQEGNAWVQPTGAHDAYPVDWVVEHGGKTWKSLTPANVWEPGVSGWREQVADVTPDPDEPETGDPETPPAPVVPAWVQPTGAHDAYAMGEKVSHDGKTWTSTADGNVWAPGVYGWVETV